MFAVCIESSHKRGMGHFYRALNILEYLQKVKEDALLVINWDPVSIQILDEKKILYEIVDYSDVTGNWERDLIWKYRVDVWLLDKFETDAQLAKHVKNENVILAAIDDCGEGARLVDLHFCSMLFQNICGINICTGKEYLILNPQIGQYKRMRSKLHKILVTLGGSDTYGVTVKVVKILKEKGYGADVIIGPNFQHREQLRQEIDEGFAVYDTVPSLIAKFYEYDLAITGGGVTVFEANASGLPSITIASEPHEIEIAEYAQQFGGCVFAGYYKNLREEAFDLDNLDIKTMSVNGMKAFPLNGIENIYHKIQLYRGENRDG